MKIVKVSANFTRPNDTTAYASGDLVANSTTAGSVSPMTFALPFGQGLRIWRVGLLKSDATPTNASFRLHLYNDSPTVTNGDNAAWLSIVAGYQGFVDIVASGQTFSDDSTGFGVYVNNSVFAPLYIVADTDFKLYGLLEARAAYTPVAQEVFTVTLLGESYT